MSETDYEVPEVPEKDIFDTAIDNKRAGEEEKKLLPPQGWYTTEVGSVTVRAYKDEKHDGRRVASFFGTLINNKDSEITTKQGFRLSPDYVESERNPGQADWNHAMFLKARRAFIESTGTEPEKDGDVIRFMAEYPVQVRLSHTKDAEVMVVAFRAVKE